jgi:hypothetical protein
LSVAVVATPGPVMRSVTEPSFASLRAAFVVKRRRTVAVPPAAVAEPEATFVAALPSPALRAMPAGTVAVRATLPEAPVTVTGRPFFRPR